MLFNSLEFLFIYLPVVAICYYAIGYYSTSLGKFILICASLFFYAWWNPSYLWLLCGSIIFNFYCSTLINSNRSNPKFIKFALIIGITSNLGTLAYFKYSNFFIDNFNFLFSKRITCLKIGLYYSEKIL